MPVNSKLNHCGVDFGTTNSTLAISNSQNPTTIPIDRQNNNPDILKSLIYLNPSHKISVGSQAIDNYLHDLKTYPSKAPRIVNTGKMIKVMTPTGSGVMKADWVPQIIEVDDSGRGRLLQSLKSVLTSSSFTGTNIFGKFYSLEDLLTMLLSQIKQNAQQEIGQQVDSVVLGRPVRYVGTGQESTALERMHRIATNSGFKNIEFEYEPIGAALNYGINIKSNQNILVFDFGGGTLDICIMKLPEKKVLSVSGRPIGGDLLNSKIAESKLFHHFGSESIINDKLSFPRYLLYHLSSWYQTTMLKNVSDISTIQDLIIKSNQPDKVTNLLNLIINDYGFEFFRTIDATKIELSTNSLSTFNFNHPNLSIVQNISQSDFENSIEAELESTKSCLTEALNLASLTPNQIDKVILTGGSSQVPIFQKLITDIFPTEKLISSDYFSAVALGLGLRAEQIFGNN